MESNPSRSVGSMTPEVHFRGAKFEQLVTECRRQVGVVQDVKTRSLGLVGDARPEAFLLPTESPFRLLGILPPLYPEWLGDRSFQQEHGVRFPYIAGAMANGIASVALVEQMAKNGFMAFFGSAGLSRQKVEDTAVRLSTTLEGTGGWGMNLIYTPHESGWEDSVVECYLRHGVKRVSASAYMKISPAIVWFACRGLSRGEKGSVLRRNFVFAKVSHPDVARKFMEPAPADILHYLVEKKRLTEAEALLAREVSLASDITVESDSGGHTDNQPLGSLFPTIARMNQKVQSKMGYHRPVRIGAAGGLGTPDGVAAAFAMGASYVLSGSVNQSCVEAGIDPSAKSLLADAGLKDMKMAPAADMFEMGVQVQVLARGTFFPFRARKLYEWYRSYTSLSELPRKIIEELERDFFRGSLKDAWDSTRRFWETRDRSELVKAEKSGRHKMALLFRSYLGLSSQWAVKGELSRQADYQIWCGPAQAAFNAWVKGSFLEKPEQRTVVQVAKNLMEGAAVLTRVGQLRTFGISTQGAAFGFKPRYIN